MIKKVFSVLLFSVLLLAAFVLPAAADGEDAGEDAISDFWQLIPDGVELSPPGEGQISDIGLDRLLSELLFAARASGGGAISFFLFIFGFAIILAGVDGGGALLSSRRSGAVVASVSVIAAVSIFSRLVGVFESVSSGLLSVCDFFGSVIPVLVGINASAGMSHTAGVSSVNMSATLAVIEKFSVEFLLPIAFSLVALSLCATVGERTVASLTKGMKNLFMWGAGVVSTVASATIAIQTLVASASDNAALRAARYAAAGTIPVVGSTVASALSTLAGGLAYARSTVGAGAIAVILSLALFPLVSLLLYRLALSVSIIFLDYAGCESGSRTYTAFRSSLDAVIAVYALSVLVLIIEVIIFLKSGGEVA